MDGKKKILFVVEAMGGVFTYIVDLANGLAEKYDMYIAYAIRPQTPSDYRDYFNKRIHKSTQWSTIASMYEKAVA